MKIIITPHEAMEKGIWLEICDLKGIGEWAVNEGQMESDEPIHLTLGEAEQLGLLRRRED